MVQSERSAVSNAICVGTTAAADVGTSRSIVAKAEAATAKKDAGEQAMNKMA